MKDNLKFNDFTNIDLGKGQVIAEEKLYKSNCLKIIISAEWPGGVRLEVSTFDDKFYDISVYKYDTTFGSFRLKGSASVLSYAQKLAKNINDGEFNNKKTDREKAGKIIEDRSLTSYMNKTKWDVLIDIVDNRLPFPPAFIEKTLFDNPDIDYLKSGSGIPSYYGDYSYEGLEYKRYLIEWIRITPKVGVNKGGRLAPKIEVQDETEEFKRELEKEHIPYEVHGDDIVIYGYR